MKRATGSGIAARLRAGMNLLLGTDNGMFNSPSIRAELDFAYKLAKSQFADPLTPDPATILKMVTRNIRPALGGDHFGQLAHGLPATFAILDFNAPHLRATRHITASIVGRVSPPTSSPPTAPAANSGKPPRSPCRRNIQLHSVRNIQI